MPTNRKLSFSASLRELMREYILNIYTIYKEVPPTQPPWLLGPITVCQRNRPTRILKYSFLIHSVKHEHCYHVYTDGSKTDDAVAIAADS